MFTAKKSRFVVSVLILLFALAGVSIAKERSHSGEHDNTFGEKGKKVLSGNKLDIVLDVAVDEAGDLHVLWMEPSGYVLRKLGPDGNEKSMVTIPAGYLDPAALTAVGNKIYIVVQRVSDAKNGIFILSQDHGGAISPFIPIDYTGYFDPNEEQMKFHSLAGKIFLSSMADDPATGSNSMKVGQLNLETGEVSLLYQKDIASFLGGLTAEGINIMSVNPQLDGTVFLLLLKNHNEFYLSRLTKELDALDTTFGVNGLLPLAGIGLFVGSHGVRPPMIVQQSDGKMIFIGEAATGSARHILVHRFLADGAPDTSFGTNGIFKETFGGGNAILHSAVLDRRGGLLIFGEVGPEENLPPPPPPPANMRQVPTQNHPLGDAA
ncbi:MAG: hypothetical protein Q7S68_02420, partial [Deltaproteobacteria bacterium]|nr:hypothetical protein [Deltaproteobacteria bacterium]